jgi:hypothetical protein
MLPAEIMKKRKNDALEEVAVDDEEYRWRVRHGWLVDKGAGLKGISISVWRNPGRTRELIIDFPFSVFSLDRCPKRSDLIAALRPAIKAAITAGWNPESRGRVFRFNVPVFSEASLKK